MPKKVIRDFPQEYPQGPWPLLQVSLADRHFTPVAESWLGRSWRVARTSLNLTALDLGVASGKGVLFGIFTCAVTFSFVTLNISKFNWWANWHWAMALGVVVLLLVLVGIDYTVAIIAIVALILSFKMMIAHPLWVALFMLGGMMIWGTIEFFPRKSS